ncbi:MAG: M48 family metalloprotease [Vicinamibacterales bacterium]
MKRIVLVMALLAWAVPASAQFGLGKALQTGMKIKDLQISEEEEREIGTMVSEKIRQRYGVVQDKTVHRYVTLVGATLASASSRPGLSWQFIVLDTDGVNAFAAPGGFVHITRGALALMQNESELAGVLGHELVHVTEQHTISAIKKNNAKDLGLEMGPGGGMTRAVLTRLADRAADMVMAGFGRGEELESDDKGVALASKVGYAPAGLSTFLTRLRDRNKDSAEKRGLFASHPEMTERLEKIEKQIAASKMAGAAVLADRYRRFVSYEPKAQSDIAQVEAGAAGLAGGSKPAASASKTDEGAKDDDKPKKRGFGLGNLMKPGSSDDKKSAQVTGSGGARGVDPERNAKGGSNPALVAVTVTASDISAFKKEGKLA